MKSTDGAMRPSYCLKLKYPLPFSISYVQLITQQLYNQDMYSHYENTDH